MGLSEYDKAHVSEILQGEGTWWSARLLRAIDDLMPYGDRDNQRKLAGAFPEEVALVLKHYQWRDDQIVIEFPMLLRYVYPTDAPAGFDDAYDRMKDGDFLGENEPDDPDAGGAAYPWPR